jgi:hypothetical protein
MALSAETGGDRGELEDWGGGLACSVANDEQNNRSGSAQKKAKFKRRLTLRRLLRGLFRPVHDFAPSATIDRTSTCQYAITRPSAPTHLAQSSASSFCRLSLEMTSLASLLR